MSFISSKFPYSYKNSLNFGRVLDFKIWLKVETIRGLKDLEFIFDTGADISMLSFPWINETGNQVDELARCIMHCASNETMNVYKGFVKIKIGGNSELLNLPVVFSDRADTPILLGKLGLLDNISANLDHRRKILTLS